MNENKQTVLTDEECISILKFGESSVAMAHAIESAVLSKLRAAGEPVAFKVGTDLFFTRGAADKMAEKRYLRVVPLYAAPQASAEVTASEAVFAFAAWLSCRDEVVEFGSTKLASTPAMLVDAFVKSQGWTEPRLDYHTRLRPYPKSAPAAVDATKGGKQ